MEIIVEKINVSHVAEGFSGIDFLCLFLVFRSYEDVTTANIDLCLALMTIEQ